MSCCIYYAPPPPHRQLGLLLFLLYDPHTLFPGILRDNACKEWTIDEVSDPSEIVGGYFCSDYRTFVNGDCTSDKEVREKRGPPEPAKARY